MEYVINIIEMDNDFNNSISGEEWQRFTNLREAKTEFKKVCKKSFKCLRNYYISLDKFNDFGYIGNIAMKEFRAN